MQQSLLNLQNCNAHDKVPVTARLLRKVISNLLKAESVTEMEKFGKLRLSNAKIRSCFVDMVAGLHCLEALGFTKKMVMNDKGVREEYMVFDFSKRDPKVLWHAMNLIDLHYPDTST